MPIDFTFEVNSGGYIKPVANYKDANDSAVTPTSASWSLYNDRGAIVNSRLNVSIATPTSADKILLQGADVTSTTGKNEGRKLVITFTFTDDDGDTVTQVDYVWIQVVNPQTDSTSA